jgi:hypothetical protein
LQISLQASDALKFLLSKQVRWLVAYGLTHWGQDVTDGSQTVVSQGRSKQLEYVSIGWQSEPPQLGNVGSHFSEPFEIGGQSTGVWHATTLMLHHTASLPVVTVMTGPPGFLPQEQLLPPPEVAKKSPTSAVTRAGRFESRNRMFIVTSMGRCSGPSPAPEGCAGTRAGMPKNQE